MSMNKQNIFEGRRQILPFLRGPQIVFYQFGKHARATAEQWANRNQEFSQ
jgi:hypothetical protein